MDRAILCRVGNVNLPTPVFLASGALCLLAGYLIGVVAGPDTPARTTAEVESFDPGTSELCLRGDGATDAEGAEGDLLCGTWRRTAGSETPEPGDVFRFVSVDVDNAGGGGDPVGPGVVIYGSVVD